MTTCSGYNKALQKYLQVVSAKYPPLRIGNPSMDFLRKFNNPSIDGMIICLVHIIHMPDTPQKSIKFGYHVRFP